MKPVSTPLASIIGFEVVPPLIVPVYPASARMVVQVPRSKVLGIVTSTIPVQVVNRPAGRVAIPTGIVRDVNAEQLLNTVLSANDVRPVGNKMDLREVLFSNILPFNTVTPVADKLIDVRPEQLMNAWLPILNKVEGRVSDSNLIQLANALPLILTSAEGKVTKLRFRQPLNELSGIFDTPEGIDID